MHRRKASCRCRGTVAEHRQAGSLRVCRSWQFAGQSHATFDSFSPFQDPFSPVKSLQRSERLQSKLRYLLRSVNEVRKLCEIASLPAIRVFDSPLVPAPNVSVRRCIYHRSTASVLASEPQKLPRWPHVPSDLLTQRPRSHQVGSARSSPCLRSHVRGCEHAAAQGGGVQRAVLRCAAVACSE